MSLPDASGNEDLKEQDIVQGKPLNIPQEPDALRLHMSQCVEGGWVQDTADGRTLDVDSNFSYVVNFKFKDEAARQAFLDRPDFEEVSNTMIKTMRDMTQSTFDLELERDFIPESYKDGVLPEDTTKQFSDGTLSDLNDAILPDFVEVMNATYPGLGLTEVKVDPESVNQTPGCYDGIPSNFADTPQEEPVASGNDMQAAPLKM